MPSEPGRRFAGSIEWGSLRSPILALLDPPHDMWSGAKTAGDGSTVVEPAGDIVPILHGHLAGHGLATALGCRFRGMRFGTLAYELSVDKLVLGCHLQSPHEQSFRRMEFEIPALGPMLSNKPIRKTKVPSRRSSQARLDVDGQRHSWAANGVTVTLEWNCAISESPSATTVSVIPRVTLESSLARSLDFWIEGWVVPMFTVVEVAVGAGVQLASLTAWGQRKPSSAKRSESAKIWMAGIGGDDQQSKSDDVLFSVAAFSLNPQGLPDVLARARDLATTRTAFTGLLQQAMHLPERPSWNVYLDLTSAIEAYDSDSEEPSDIAIENYKTAKRAAMEAMKQAQVPSRHRKFVKSELPSQPRGPSLESRLRRLAGEVGILESWVPDPTAMARLRNDIAHGNIGTDMASLGPAKKQVFDLARRLFLRDLGIPSAGS